MAIPMKRLRRWYWGLIAAALVAGWLLMTSDLWTGVTPPAHVTDVRSFVDWDGGKAAFWLAETGRHVVARKDGLPWNGPAEYVFDSAGAMIDWHRDVATESSFQDKWKRSDRELGASEVMNWIKVP